ncbi:hypothetical protein CDL15_Pgr021262 [Punica granatum]|uniref:Surfeit locus protein 2 n=1 Tax=Punica granatum TaxID=22663 RepID=A0A218WRQ8_PUNGR|nr:hypothetical protein CDL15_Pgr021262 [Punica granatum]
MAAAATDVAAEEGEKEGAGLVAPPTFAELPNGRVKCVETGYEMITGDVQCYSRSKRCRLGLIDFALAHNKPPLNMFKQDPLCRSMLICKLTGDRVNKSEKHIWKHINGRSFYKLYADWCFGTEQKEEVDVTSKRKMGVVNMKKKKEEQKTKKTADEIKSELRDPSERNSNFAGDSGDFELISGAESEQDSDKDDLDRKIVQIIDIRLVVALERRLDVFVNRLTERMGALMETRQEVDSRRGRVPNSTTKLEEIEYDSNFEGDATLFFEEDSSDDAFFVAGDDGEPKFDEEKEIMTGNKKNGRK